MIKEISISGFKAFCHQTIKLGKLTVFSGLNNSGKSSAMQALRMCLAGSEIKGPYLEGLGSYTEIKSHHSEKAAPISLEIKGNNESNTKLIIDHLGYQYIENKLTPILQFISADRFGPRVGLPTMPEDIQNLTVGNNGEYSAHYASILENSLVANLLRHPECVGNTLKHQLTWWMREISPGIKLNFEVLRSYDSSQLSVDGFRPTNAGFGISYTLPILLCLLTMTGNRGEDDSNARANRWFSLIKENGGILLIENPEAHLHPKGQTCIGKLAALAASCGLQIVLETHSDHVIDGIRLAVKQYPEINAEDVSIKFFNKIRDTSPEIEDIVVLKSGKLDHWPNGFFDQYSINLRSLASKNPNA